MSLAVLVVAYIETHPGCIQGLYDLEDRGLVDESVLLNAVDWVNATEPGESPCYENWSEAITWADGIRCCVEKGEVLFEEV